MQVSVKDFGIDMDVKNKGMQLAVSDRTGHLGNLFITKTGLIWCKGKTRREGGKKTNWQEFMEIMET